MGPDGFVSCFDHLMPECVLKRKLILKGGPGVGKSTFMRRLHAALCDPGNTSTLYFCSGDPDSLDAVALPHLGLLILDGTAPHVVDPHIPGARDSLINLGVCLNESAMRPRLPHIRSCMNDHSVLTRRARACMQAAWALTRDNALIAASAADPSRLQRITRALIQTALSPGAPADEAVSVRPVITDALTPKGELSLIAQSAQPRVIRIIGHPSMDLTPVLMQISRAAQAAGFRVEEHLCPMRPGGLMHLTIPALSTLITTSETLAAEQIFDFSSCIPAGSLLRHECMLEQGRAASQQHLQRAASALAQAKQLHDELETFYVPSMDFTRWQVILDETLASLRG